MRETTAAGTARQGTKLKSGILLLILAGFWRAAPGQEVEAPPVAGPVRVFDQFLLNIGFLDFEPPPFSMVPEGRWRLELSLAAANTFARSDAVKFALEVRDERAPVDDSFLSQVETISRLQERGFLLDGELFTSKLRLRRGLGRGAELELTLPVHTVHGGGFDTVVEAFHGALGVDQDGRQSVPRDGFLLYMQTAPGQILIDEAPGTRIGDAVIAARKAVDLPWKSYHLVADGRLKLPTGESARMTSSGSVDALIQGLLSRCRRRACLHGGLGARYLGAWSELRLEPQVVLSSMIGYDVRLASRMSLVAQLSYSESPYDGLGLEAIAEDMFQFALGWKGSLADGQVISLALVENLVHFENGADIGVHVELSQRF